MKIATQGDRVSEDEGRQEGGGQDGGQEGGGQPRSVERHLQLFRGRKPYWKRDGGPRFLSIQSTNRFNLKGRILFY